MPRNTPESRSPSFVSSQPDGSSGRMATLTKAQSEPNLLALEEDLTCSICLSIFDAPVTVPCGHNFCAYCLEQTWASQVRDFSCPQCRTTFPDRPQLHKNTVLCRVVEQLQGCGDGKEDDEHEEEEQEAAAPIYCDSCLQAAATQTCLTCMASFCPEHLRPHYDSPAFRHHQLCPPVRDLQQRKCPQHNKLFEFFCSQHSCCICSLCLLSHKLCHTSPLQQAKDNAEVRMGPGPEQSSPQTLPGVMVELHCVRGHGWQSARSQTWAAVLYVALADSCLPSHMCLSTSPQPLLVLSFSLRLCSCPQDRAVLWRC